MQLPLDAKVDYFPDFLAALESKRLYDAILSASDLSDMTIVAGGKVHTLNIGKCMFVDPSLMDYDLLPEAQGHRQPWISEVQDLKERVESVSGTEYNVCVCIYYKDGESGVDFHSDPPAFGDVSSIASVSLGQEREFAFRRTTNHDETYSLRLKDGSLLIMGDKCQELYEHALPEDPDRKHPRINLTFRAFGWA